MRFIGEVSIHYSISANEYFNRDYSEHFDFDHHAGGDIYHALKWAHQCKEKVDAVTVIEKGIRGKEIVMQINEYAGNHSIFIDEKYHHIDMISVNDLKTGKSTLFLKQTEAQDTPVCLTESCRELPPAISVIAGFFACTRVLDGKKIIVLREPLQDLNDAIIGDCVPVVTKECIMRYVSTLSLWDACKEFHEIISRDFFLVSRQGAVYYTRGGEVVLYEPPEDVAVHDPALAFGLLLGFALQKADITDEIIYSILQKMTELRNDTGLQQKAPFFS